VGESPFRLRIAALLRPLEFAARDDFAQLERVRELDRTVTLAAEQVCALAIPPEAKGIIARVAKPFASPPIADPASRVRDALEVLRPIAQPSWAEAQLEASTASLPGLGAKRSELLARRGLRSVGDVLFHLPVRYDDRRSLQRIGDLTVGQRATFVARVLGSAFTARRGRYRGRVFEAMVGDETGTILLKWFQGGDSISRQVKKGAHLLVTGDVKRYRFDKEVAHPEISQLEDAAGGADALQKGLGIVADYSTPEGIHPRAFRRAVSAAVERFADLVPGYLSASGNALDLPEPADALRALHEPASDSDVAGLISGEVPARARLVLEELFLLELGLALRRSGTTAEAGIAIPAGRRAAAVAERLPFALTQAQERARREIAVDVARPHPMNRLLEGDVGSGKTVVAFLAAVAVAEHQHQTALMAPTELLAEQHERTLQKLASDAGGRDGLRIARLTASLSSVQSKQVRAALKAGEIDLVIGTQALLQEGVDFRALALAIVDEQHRFGVRQRAALTQKAAGGLAPHTLVMTATPIPRSLALTLHGDLDLSVIDELPPGRSPTETLLFREGEGRRVADLIRATTARGEQAYVVYPLVAESEKLDLRSATESTERIRAAFPQLKIDLVHGQLDAAARHAAMARFAAGDTNLLVSTTVIEVGVDVSNATLMVVEHAERFGLAQLHQLRGRIGRGRKKSTCVLMARGVSEDSEARLRALLQTTDGFEIAEADLRIRGPGEFLGTRQHGRLPDLRIADLVRDVRHVVTAREAALETLRRDPNLRSNPSLARAVRARWGDRLSLASVG
jgi:ATP-dependent DNA helicase RecG